MKRLALCALPLFLCAVPMLLCAQTLTPVTAPSAGAIDWWILGPIIIVVVLAGGFLYLKKKNPAAATTAATAASADFATLTAAMHRLATAVEAKLSSAPPAATPAPAAEPAAPPPAGKSGQAGVFTLTVTGDPKADLAAIQQQYFG